MTAQGMLWPHLLADLEAKRDALGQMIETIRTHFVGDTPGEMPDSTPPRGGGPTKNAANERTNERTNEARRAPAARSRPDDEKDHAIIAILTKHGGTMKPGDLARALRVTPSAMRVQIKPLVKSGAVLATGKTMNRQFSLPPRGRAAKEAP